MRSVSRNVLANFAGHFWIVFLNLALVPLYLPLVGVEAYGLVGFYNALLAVFSIIDNGLGIGATREIALRSSSPQAGSIQPLIRSLEWIYWPVAAVAGVLCVSLSPWLSHRWFAPQQISYQTLGTCLALLGANLAFRFPAGLYTGVLTGLQRQAVINLIRMAYSTLSGVGALVILTFVWRAPEAFFAWQVVTGLLNVVALAFFAWRNAPPAIDPVRYTNVEIRALAGFATGNALTALLVLLLTQTDRVLLSTLVPLAQFGIYTLAANLNSGLAGLANTATSVLFPRFAQLAAESDQSAAATFLHRSAQFISVIMIPLCLAVITVMDILLSLWLRDQAIALAAVTPARLLIAGSVFNALVGVPYALVLGRGNTRFGVVLNSISVALLVPLLYFLILRFGIDGAAAGWLSLNLGYYLIAGVFMLRLILPEHTTRWYLADTAAPLLVCGAVFGVIAGCFVWCNPSPIVRLVIVGGATVCVMVGLTFHFRWMWDLSRNWIRALRALSRKV